MMIDQGTATDRPRVEQIQAQTKGPAALLLVLAGFQACLAAGAPWGRAAYGGQHSGTLPIRYRCISVVGTVAYAAMAFALTRSGGSRKRQRALLGGVAATMAIGAVPNAFSRSPLERGVWTPYCVLTAALAWRARRLTV